MGQFVSNCLALGRGGLILGGAALLGSPLPASGPLALGGDGPGGTPFVPPPDQPAGDPTGSFRFPGGCQPPGW